MISPSVLRAALVAAMQGVSAFSAFEVVEYIEESGGDVFSRIRNLEPETLHVRLERSGPSGERMTLWNPQVAIAIRTAGDPFQVFADFVNALLNTQIHENYHQMSVPEMIRQTIPVSADTFFDYWEIRTGFTSRNRE